jgi:hypothetical protein
MSPAHRWLPFVVFYLMALTFAALIIVPVALAQPAAAPVADGVVDFSPLIDAVIAAIGAALIAVATWIGRSVTIWFGLKSDSEIRRYVQDAMARGVEFAVKRAANYSKDHGKISVKSDMLETALEYVVAAVPDGLKRLGLDDAAVRQAIEARLPEIGPAK